MKRYFLIFCTLACMFCVFGCKKDHALPKFPPPTWEVEQAAQFSTTMTAVVQVPAKLTKNIQKADQLAAFINGTCRGTGSLVQSADIAVFFVLIHGPSTGNEEIQFKYYSSLKRHMYVTEAFLPFEADGNFGTVDNPEVLDLSPVK